MTKPTTTQRAIPDRAREAPPRSGRFQKGRTQHGGRQCSTPNVMTTKLKDAIIAVAHCVASDGKGKDGLVGYLKHMGLADPKTFVMLLRVCL
jgi:hypothetical protein